jgi:hypothetical protein
MWEWQTYGQSSRRLEATMEETEVCRQLSVSLAELRKAGDVPAQTEMPEDQLYRVIHEAAQAAGVDEGSAIRSIHPQPAHAVRGSSFQEKNVELSLQGLTLEQLVRFFHHLCTANPQLHIAEIALHDPKGIGAATVWNVEPVTLTYRVEQSLERANASDTPLQGTALNR